MKNEVQVGAVRSWALVHGLAMLMLDGQVPADDALIDRIVDPTGSSDVDERRVIKHPRL